MKTEEIGTYRKDTNEVKDIVFNFADWLEVGETIVSRVVTPETGITVTSSSITDAGTKVTAWLGAVAVEGHVMCQVVTSAARTDRRLIRVKPVNKSVS